MTLEGRTISVALLVVLLLCSAPAILAQVTAQITGTVTDSTGATIPGAEITATKVDTGQTRTSLTDIRGSYLLLSLPTGRYTLKVSKSGFETFEQENVILDVNSAAQINVTLKVGSTVTAVVVQANPVSVETVSTQLGDVISGASISSLPLNGRSFTDLLGLQPGVVPISAGTIDPGTAYGGSSATGNLSINGQREDANGFLVNGGSVRRGEKQRHRHCP